jgi:hypothetical protein
MRGDVMDITITAEIERWVRIYAGLVNAEDFYNRIGAHTRLRNLLEGITGKNWGLWRPFESEEIVAIPSFEECEDIIWRSIREFDPD